MTDTACHLSLESCVLDLPVDEIRSLVPGAAPQDRVTELPGHGLVAHVLQDVSLTLGPGERLVLLGRNGSGKTMLMRTLAGALRPSSGSRRASGRVVSMLDPGFGLALELRGSDNVRIAARFFGYGSRALPRILAEVEAISELGPFLHMPVRTYSSGMVMRLAFAIAMAVRPDILLLDEWFFTADAEFLTKAKERLDATLGTGGILILSTHALDIAAAWCPTAILMEKGRIIAKGQTAEVIGRYQSRPRPQ